MKIAPSSASALTWLSIILLVAGGSIGSPAGRLFCLVLAGLLAAIPCAFAAGKRRLFAGFVLCIAVVAGYVSYAEGDASYEAYLRQQH